MRVSPILLVVACTPEDPVLPEIPSGPGVELLDPVDEPEPLFDGDGDGSPSTLDCDDGDPTVFPGAPDHCGDERVTDCDRTADEHLVTVDGVASFADLSLALLAASEGSEVLLCPGTYYGGAESLVSVHLVSWGGREVTVLDGAHADRTLTVPAGSTLAGLTIQGGEGFDNGGGVLVTGRGALTVTDCLIRGNHSFGDGGGIAVPVGSTVTVTGSVISGNTATRHGGGLFAGWGSTIDLTGSVVEDNRAAGGGGIYLRGSTLVGGVVSSNRAGAQPGPILQGGGGVATVGVSTIQGTEVAFNEGAWSGGGVWTEDGELDLVDVWVHDNLAAFFGGGLGAVGTEIRLSGTTALEANTATASGGGLAAEDGSVTGGRIAGNVALAGGGAYLASADLTGAVVEGNAATDGGGGLYLWSASPIEAPPITVRDAQVIGNVTAGSGGGIYVYATCARATLDGVEVTDNVADEGGGLAMITETWIQASTIARNQAPIGGGAYWWGSEPLRSFDSDWSVDGDDNVPEDVYDQSAAMAMDDFGANASFDCGPDEGCTLAFARR